jgi:hypothetical protein
VEGVLLSEAHKRDLVSITEPTVIHLFATYMYKKSLHDSKPGT